MRFSLKFVAGLLSFLAGLGAAGLGVKSLNEGLAKREEAAEAKPKDRQERVFSVVTGRIDNSEIQPKITAYGEIRSWRTLEIRASTGGYVVNLAEEFRDGVSVEKDAFLFAIDPKEYKAAVADARAAVSEAEADLKEATQSVGVTERELAAADTQRDLRASALARQEDLLRRGVATSSVVEEAEMSLASAEQTAASRAQMLLTSEVKIDRNRLRLERAKIALSEAQRDLAETEHRAPFGGLVSDVTIVLGGLAAPNERLGLLIDPTALEVAFRVTNAQFARLLSDDDALRKIAIDVTLELDETPLTLPGVIDRAGAIIEAGETGRLIYAKIGSQTATLLRPGDFVTVTITEPPLSDVARIPAASVTEEGELLLVDNDRLTTSTVRILRRLGDDVVVSGAPQGAIYVADRAPQLGKGVKVKIVGDNAAPSPTTPANLVTLDPAHQEKMIAWVEANTRLPEEMKSRILKRLRTGKAPQRMIDRLNQRIGG